MDAAGNLYIADYGNHRVRRVDLAGRITTVAGTGDRGYGGDGGPATAAQLGPPSGLAMDAAGNLYIADHSNRRVRRVDTTGEITTVAGNGTQGDSGDGGPAPNAQLIGPYGVAVDAAGNLYIADRNNHRVRRVDPAGTITTVAGTGRPGYSGDGGPSTAARLGFPRGLTLDRDGNLLIADSRNHRIRRVALAGRMTGGQLPSQPGDDHANDPSSATRVALNSSVGGAIEQPGDIDWFRLETSGPRHLKVRTTGSLDTVGTLFDSSNRPLAEDDDSGGGANFALEAEVSAGVYYVRVRAYSGSQTGSYTVEEHGEAAFALPSGTITTVAGTGEERSPSSQFNGEPAISASLWHMQGVAVDATRNLYIADTYLHVVHRVDTAGRITTVAGTGFEGYSGDGGPATSAQLRGPAGMALDAAGNLYIADSHNHSVRRVDAAGTITTVAGIGIEGFSGDGGPATIAQLAFPWGVAVDGAGNLYIADRNNQRVRRVDAAGTITTVAGTGVRGAGGDGSPATSAQLNNPTSVAVDAAGNLYIADSFNSRARRVDTAGTITTVAGTGMYGYEGDGGPAANANLSYVDAVAVDRTGVLFISDGFNHRIRAVDSSGTIMTVAGSGPTGRDVGGYGGDGGPANAARLNSPSGLAVDANGNLYIADSWNRRVRKVIEGGSGGAPGLGLPDDHGNDPSGATRLALNSSVGGAIEQPGDIDWFRLETSEPRQLKVRTTGSLDTVGTLFDSSNQQIATDDDGGSGNNFALEAEVPAGVYYVRVRAYSSSQTGSYTIEEHGEASIVAPVEVEPGTIVTVAGTGTAGYSGDGGLAVDAQVAVPLGVAVDSQGNLYMADTENHRVRMVDPSGTVVTVAGTGAPGYSGDGGPAVDAQLAQPFGVATDAAGNLYVADTGNYVIRRVDPTGRITTVAGNGTQGDSGDGGPAVSAQIGEPLEVAADGAGNLYIASLDNQGIRRVDRSGRIETVAGVPSAYGIAVDEAGTLYVPNVESHVVHRVDPSGRVTTVAGTGTRGYSGDGGPATSARIHSPTDVAVDSAGNLYIVDTENYRVRRVDPSGVIATVAGTGTRGYSGDGGPATSARLGGSEGILRLAVDPAGNLYIADTENHRVRKVTLATVGVVPSLPPADDHADDPSGATRLGLNSSLNGAIETDGDEDWFRLEASEPRQLKVRTTGSLDTVGTLFDSSNQQIATDDDGGSGNNFALEAEVPAGVYYVRVRAYSRSETGSYVIEEHGEAAIAAPVEVEPGTTTTVAGTGTRGYSGDGGSAADAQLSFPEALAVDASGNLYIADSGNERVRRVDPSGVVTTVAGSGTRGYGGDGAQAVNARLSAPRGVALDAAGNLYIADSHNGRVRKVDTSGRISTVAGNGRIGYGGDGGPALEATLNNIQELAVDAAGNLYIADTANHRVRKVGSSGVITTVAGTGTQGYGGDGGLASAAQLNRPRGVAVDAAGNLYIADSFNERVRKVDTSGVITTVAGTGERGNSGDGGPAVDAEIAWPAAVAVDAAGNLYIAARFSHAVRKVDQTGVITTVPEHFNHADGVAVDAAGNLYVAAENVHRVYKVTGIGAAATGGPAAAPVERTR